MMLFLCITQIRYLVYLFLPRTVYFAYLLICIMFSEARFIHGPEEYDPLLAEPELVPAVLCPGFLVVARISRLFLTVADGGGPLRIYTLGNDVVLS
jgi:hypothetical protein